MPLPSGGLASQIPHSCFCFDSRLSAIALTHTSPNSVTLFNTESNPLLFPSSFFPLAFLSLDFSDIYLRGKPSPPPPRRSQQYLGNMLLAHQKTRRQHPHIFPISHTYLLFNFHFLSNFPIHEHFKLCLYVSM